MKEKRKLKRGREVGRKERIRIVNSERRRAENEEGSKLKEHKNQP